MSFQFIAILAVMIGISLVGSNILVSSVSGLSRPFIKIDRYCDSHPCIIIPRIIIEDGCPPFCYPPPELPKKPGDGPWPKLMQNLTEGQSLIITPFNGSALVIKALTQDIEITNNLTQQQ